MFCVVVVVILDPDQMPRSAGSDLVVLYLPRTLKRAR